MASLSPAADPAGVKSSSVKIVKTVEPVEKLTAVAAPCVNDQDEMDEKGSEWPQTSEIASGIYSWECYGKKRIIHCHPELWTSLRSIAEHFRAHPTPGVEFTIHVGHLKNWKCTILPKEESETVSTATVSPSQSVESSIETTFPLDRLVHRRMYPQACIPMAVMWDFDFVQPPPVPIDWTNVNWESVTSQDGIAINRKPRM